MKNNFVAEFMKGAAVASVALIVGLAGGVTCVK